MLFDDRFLFIHAPKTAGMSVTRFLIDNAPKGVTLTVPDGHGDRAENVTVMKGTRHERLPEAAAFLAKLGRRLEDFELILSIARNPYDLEVSYYHYKRLGHPYDKGPAQKIAMKGNFALFAKKAAFHGRLPARIEDWYEIDGAIPPNLKLLRFENLEQELYDTFGKLYPIVHPLAKLNSTRHEPYRSYLTPAVERAIYSKYRWLFDNGYYARERLSADSAPARRQRKSEVRRPAGRLPKAAVLLAQASLRALKLLGIAGSIFQLGDGEGRFLEMLRPGRGESAVLLQFAPANAASPPADGVEIVEIDPDDESGVSEFAGEAKLVAIRTESTRHTGRALALAKTLLAEKGIVVLSDIPSVSEAVARDLLGRTPKFMPIAFGGGLLVLCDAQSGAQLQGRIIRLLKRAHVRVTMRPLFGKDLPVVLGAALRAARQTRKNGPARLKRRSVSSG